MDLSIYIVCLGTFYMCLKFAHSWSISQPRIAADKRNLLIIGAQNRNLSLYAHNGYINLNDKDIGKTVRMAKAAFSTIRNFEFEEIGQVQTSLVKLKEDVNMKTLARIVRFEKYFGTPGNETNLSISSRTVATRFRKSITLLTRIINNLSKSFQNLKNAITSNECSSNPCTNGGTCVNTYGGFNCICPSNWEGAFCDIDVDECSHFHGTDLGCQNGATCLNSAGSYRCMCQIDWFGTHCTKRTFDCTNVNSPEMCGHGVCVNQGGSGKGFICICDQGWKVPDSKPQGIISCIQDVDECASSVSPCSHNPNVSCTNTPGSFQCSPCPSGYSGNGYQCADIDECQTNNGGCSTNPPVDCINIRGSRLCGPCPPGFSGNGENCVRFKNLCVNNGGCNSLAKCVYNSGMNQVTCQCPSGYSGSGIGPNGCNSDISAVDFCTSSPCINGGYCIPEDSGYKCHCTPLFTGKNCEIQHDSCSTNPCRNGGTCEMNVLGDFKTKYFCRCAFGFTGIHCDDRADYCVETLTAQNGTLTRSIKYQEYNKQSKAFQSCSWTIETSNSKALSISFSQFKYPGDSISCTFKEDLSLRIYDGITRDSRLIGQYCGNKTIPESVTSTHNAIRIISEGFVSSDGEFTLNWTTVDPVCGGNIIVDTHGTISSPGYPGAYPKNTDCLWSLYSNIETRIKLIFFSFDLEPSQNCTDDYLEIRNGYGHSSSLLIRICNSTIPAPVVTSSHQAVIVFHSDTFIEGKGFQLSYTTIPGIPGCGGTLTTPSGRIAIPHFFSDEPEYETFLYCVWKIQLLEGERIKIEFKSTNHTTFGSYIKVLDGHDRSLTEWDLKTPMPSITSKTNILTITYTDFHYLDYANFIIDYTLVCGGVFTEESGIIKSPFYPHHYLRNRVCYYTIKRPAQNAILLQFLDFDLEPKFAQDCLYDSLEVFDGNTETSSHIGTYCGSVIPNSITSKHNFLFLKFSSENLYKGRGFYANYTSIPLNCGGIFSENSGIISHTGFDIDTCLWILKAPENHFVQLTWIEFSTSLPKNCTTGINIYDNALSPLPKNQIGQKYCRKPPLMTSFSNIMLIELIPDFNRVDFKANYSFETVESSCDMNYLSSVGTIMSPNYPKEYPKSSNCTYTITVQDGKQIRLFVEDFSLFLGDSLEIRNGGTENSPLIGIYSDNLKIKEFRSHANKMFLRFVSKTVGQGKGFKIKWDGFSDGCGGDLTSSSGSLISPNYPSAYGKIAGCIWKIATSFGNTLKLTIDDIDLERSNCTIDYIEIFDGNDKSGNILGRYCNQEKPTVIKSTTNFLYIAFHSNPYVQGRGFHISYETVCNNTISGVFGAIESPNFPDYYGGSDCFWELVVPPGNKIKMIISHLKIDTDVFIEIAEGSTSERKTNILLTIDKIPEIPQITSLLNHVFIHFKSTIKNYKNAFRLEWEVSGCGGLIKESGEFKSPERSDNSSLVCEWHFNVEPGKNIFFTIHEINLEFTPNCTKDSLDIYSSDNDKSPLLSSMCLPVGKHMSYTISVYGNKALVRYKSSNSHSKKGFRATFTTRTLGCGGNFKANSGQVHSMNYPKNYSETVIDCIYLISTEENSNIRLNFTDFDVPSDANCTRAFVQVFAASKWFGQFCNDNPPHVITSVQSRIILRLFSRKGPTGRGFLASYEGRCGSRIVSYNDKGGSLLKQNNMQYYFKQPNEKCIWVISSKKIARKTTLTLTSLLLSPSNGNRTYIEIYAGDGIESVFYRNITGNKIPPSIIVPSPIVTLVFLYLPNTYFNLDYSFLDTACGGTLNSEEGKIVSPNYPDYYPPNIECTWVINLSLGNRLSLQFSKLQITKSDNCNEDYVEIRETTSSGKILGLFCDQKPEVIHVNTSVWIRFRSSENSTEQGFELDYTLDHGTTLSGLSGQIQSPLYPTFHQNSEKDYRWRIEVNSGSIIRILVEKYDILATQSTGLCTNSKLMIYDGYNEEAPLLKEACSSETLISKTNVVFIKAIFRSSSRFVLNYTELNQNPIEESLEKDEKKRCHLKIFLSYKQGYNQTYNFTSPGFPQGYDNNLDCEWIIETDQQYHIEITFQVIDFEQGFCYFTDYIIVYNLDEGVDEENSIIDKLCYRNQTDRIVIGGNIVKVVFKSDSYRNGSGFLASATIECGGHITEPRGTISTPRSFFNSTNSYLSWTMYHFIKCNWTITVKPGERIKIKILKLNIRNVTSCSNGYLMLRNGGDYDSPFLGNGKFCGSIEQPQELETTANKLFIKVEQTRTWDFKIQYEEVSLKCDYDIFFKDDLKSFNISSPNYPNVPPSHTECKWKFWTKPGNSIHFQLSGRFDLTHDPSCKYEYLELREGSSEMGQLIGRFCSEIPSFLMTSGNVLFVKYFTDVADPRDGFKAEISLSKCGGTFYYQNSGIISLSSVLNRCESNICRWSIIGEPQTIFSLNIDRISPNNKGLNLTVSENQIRHFKHFYGYANESRTYESQTNNVTVIFEFNCNKILPDKQLQIRFFSSINHCGGTLEFDQGELSSPGYPKSTIKSYCYWTIVAPLGKKVTLALLDVDIASPNLSNNSLLVYNSYGNSLKEINLMGIPKNTSIESSGRSLSILYLCEECGTHRGFKANYTTIKPTSCGGYLEGNNGSFVFVNDGSEDNFYCEWEYKNTNFDSTVTFKFEGELGEKSDKFCQGAKSKILVRSEDRLYGFSCGISTKENPFSVSTQGSVEIIAMSQIAKSGQNPFNFTWTTSDCGGMLFEPTELTSPGFPNNYRPNMDCVWIILFSKSKSIRIKFNDFSMDPECQDYLEFRNGDTPTSPLIMKYCEKNKPPKLSVGPLNFSGLIRFHTSNNQYKGFNITFLMEDSDCSGIFHNKHDVLKSPNYPNLYENNLECEWQIEAPRGYHIGINFVDRIQIEESPGCINDYLEFSEHFNGTWVKINRLCGRSYSSINSTSNKLKIKFKTNDKIRGSGFSLEWNFNCGGVIKADGEGYIFSPNFPEAYGKNLYCNYTIFAPGKYIKAHFDTFELENGVNGECSDYVKIQTYDNIDIYSIKKYPIKTGKFCGKNLPPEFNSYDSLEIVFRTDPNDNFKGFNLKYTTESCGTTITSPSKLFLPPGDFNSFNCSWKIIAPKSKVVIVRISSVQLLTSERCEMDYIKIWDGSNENKTMITTLCGILNTKIANFKTKTNEALIEIYILRSMWLNDIKIVVDFAMGEASGCGGSVVLESKPKEISFNSNKVSNESYIECHWDITGPEGQNIYFKIKQISFDGYLEIFDGLSRNDESIIKTNLSITEVTSSHNLASFLFIGGKTSSFVVSLKPILSLCGELILNATDKPKYLTSPNYPNSYPINVHCIWHLISDNKRVTVNIVNIDLEESENCKADRLEIKEIQENIITERFDPDRKYYIGMDTPNVLKYLPQDLYRPINLKFCGKEGYDFYSTSRYAEIKFISNSETTGSGFKIKYQSESCNMTHKNMQGRIKETVLFPCLFTISPSDIKENTSISLYFTQDFGIREKIDCNSSSIKVYEGLSTSEVNLISKSCRGSVPDPIFTKSKAVTIYVKPNLSFNYVDLTYTTTDKGLGCGGKLIGSEGVFTSQFYPNNFRNYSSCEWFITVPFGYVPVVHFKVFDIGPHETCASDYLQILDVGKDKNVFRAKHCGEVTPADFKGNTRTILIRYKTSIHNGGTGFSASFYSSDNEN